MKPTCRALLLFLTALALLLTGCSRANKIALFATDTATSVFPTSASLPPTSAQPSATPLPSNTPFPSETPLPTSTATPLPPTQTFTPVYTNTPQFTSTATPLPRATAIAYFVSKPPVIDGPWDEWTSKQYPITNVVFGLANWSGKADLQASYRVEYDNKYLYVAVKVFDDVYAQHAQGQYIYLGDSIEILVSTNPDADSASLGLIASDYQVGISPGRPDIGVNMEAFRWFPASKAGSLTDVAIGAVPMTGGYRIEFAIPWSDLDMTPSTGKVIGFAVSVSDNDKQNENVQQTLISNAPHRSLTNPTTWGLLTLK